MQEIEAVSDAAHKGQMLLRQQDSHTELLVQAHQQVTQLMDKGLAQPAGRLIKDQQARAGHQRPGERQLMLVIF